VQFHADVPGWSPWPLDRLAQVLPQQGWWLSGGCAIEHVVGRRIRPHGDIDVSVIRESCESVLASLVPNVAWAAVDGQLLPLDSWSGPGDAHNIWVQDPISLDFIVQVNVEATDGKRWAYRREPAITLPWPEAVQHVRGVPTGSLCTQLLWKSKSPRERDDLDFAVSLERLTPEQHDWLWGAITLAHPTSPWLHRM
jgi:hypothetical protein